MRITGLRETVLEKPFEEHWEGEPYTLLKLGHYLGSIKLHPDRQRSFHP